MKPCVEPDDFSGVWTHLAMTFGRNLVNACPCGVSRPDLRVPFEVFEPIEYWKDEKGASKGVLSTGIYRISDSHVRTIIGSHEIRLQKRQEDGSWSEIDEHIVHGQGWIYLGWERRSMIDWRGVRPANV